MKWKLKVDNVGIALLSVFYAVVGCLLLFYAVLSGFVAPPHVAVVGLLSLITAYGLLRMKKWAVILVITLFFIGVTFGATTLYPSVVKETFNPNFEILLFHTGLVLYLALIAVATLYVASRRRIFGEG